MRRLLLAALLTALPSLPQAPSSDRETYERYRAWISMQPPAVQRDPAHMREYRRHLAEQGFKDIDQQIRTVEQQGRRLEVERWNAILTAPKPRFNTSPNAFLTELVRGRTPGTALDVGMGQGRNAVWLAQQSWTVTGFDPAEKAVALAQQNASNAGVKISTEIRSAEDYDFGENKWDLILLSYVGARGMNEKIQRALKPGGIVVLEAFHRDAARERSIGRAVVFDSGELPGLFRDLRVVRYEEPMAVSDFGQERVRVVRLCAEKP